MATISTIKKKKKKKNKGSTHYHFLQPIHLDNNLTIQLTNDLFTV